MTSFWTLEYNKKMRVIPALFIALFATLFVGGCAHIRRENSPKTVAEVIRQDLKEDQSSNSFNNPKEITVRGVKLQNTQFDIPITINSKVEHWVDYFTGRGREHFERYLERSELYIPYITPILKQNGLPEDLVYLAMIESGFNNHARSRAKAVGPWQFISGTGKKYGLMVNWWVDERRDTKKSTLAAVQFLKDLHEMFQSWELAIAAYNSGESKIIRAIRRYGVFDFWVISKQRFLRPETRDYVPKMIAAALIAKNRTQFGFQPSSSKPIQEETLVGDLSASELTELEIDGPADLLKIASAAELPYPTIKNLNPEILRWCTPPQTESYRIKLPTSVKDKFLATYNHSAFPKKIEFMTYKVRKGENITRVARHFGIHSDPISELNHLSPKSPLQVGSRLFLPMPNDRSRSLASLEIKDPPEKRKHHRKGSRKLYRVTYKNREGARAKPVQSSRGDT